MGLTQWTAGADYFVASLPRAHAPGQGLELSRKAEEAAAAQGDGFERKPARWYGYTGWQIGRVFFGERPDGHLLRATGAVADLVAFTLPSAGLSIARLDLAVTCWFDEDDMMIAKRAQAAAAVSRETRALPKKPKIRLQDGTGDGDTLYLGSRKSAVFGRVYDKGRATNEAFYEHSWRWEIELHNRTADKVYAAIEGEEDRQETIAASVSSWFSSRGVECPVTCANRSPVSIRAPCEPSDLVKQLQWLERQVRPVLNKLLKQGREADILQALGLIGHIGRAEPDQ